MSVPVPPCLGAEGEVSVKTEAGTFRGRDLRGANFFPHIAYAQPPVGELRWRRTRLEEKARQRPEAVECPQVIGDSIPANPVPLPQSEDCLYLNVWTPKAAGKHPVVFLIHGGGLLAGTGLKEIYDGSVFARQGVVFVSFNYRLAALGYGPNLEKEPGSLGLMDQGLALAWVAKHISAFGGDPDRVFLMGHSKGAEAIVALVNSGLAGPGVKGGIAMSGPRQFDVGIRPFIEKFRPGEQREDPIAMLKKKGFYLYVPDLPSFRHPGRREPVFSLLVSSLYDEGSLASPLSMYCSNTHFLEQFPEYIDAYHYVWHSPSPEHGAEVISLFREDAFGRTIMEHLLHFIRERKPPKVFPWREPTTWRQGRETIHVYPSFSFADEFELPPMPPGGVNYASRVGAVCESKELPGSKISRAYYLFERLLRWKRKLF